MTADTRATLSVSTDPHLHVWQFDPEKPSRSTCSCGASKQFKPVPWSDHEAAPKDRRRARAGRKAKRPPDAPKHAIVPTGDGGAPKLDVKQPKTRSGINWKRGPKG